MHVMFRMCLSWDKCANVAHQKHWEHYIIVPVPVTLIAQSYCLAGKKPDTSDGFPVTMSVLTNV